MNYIARFDVRGSELTFTHTLSVHRNYQPLMQLKCSFTYFRIQRFTYLLASRLLQKLECMDACFMLCREISLKNFD